MYTLGFTTDVYTNVLGHTEVKVKVYTEGKGERVVTAYYGPFGKCWYRTLRETSNDVPSEGGRTLRETFFEGDTLRYLFANVGLGAVMPVKALLEHMVAAELYQLTGNPTAMDTWIPDDAPHNTKL